MHIRELLLLAGLVWLVQLLPRLNWLMLLPRPGRLLLLLASLGWLLLLLAKLGWLVLLLLARLGRLVLLPRPGRLLLLASLGWIMLLPARPSWLVLHPRPMRLLKHHFVRLERLLPVFMEGLLVLLVGIRAAGVHPGGLDHMEGVQLWHEELHLIVWNWLPGSTEHRGAVLGDHL